MYILYTFTYVLHPSADRGEHVFVTRTFFRGCVRVRNSKNVLSDRAARNTYLTRYDIIIFIHIHVIIMYTEGGGAFLKSIDNVFFVVFISFRLTLVLMGSSTATTAAATTRNSTVFAPFPQPPNPCVDNDDVTTTWSLFLLAGPFIFSVIAVVYVYCVCSVYAYTMRV